MSSINFKISDEVKFDMLWSLLNTEYNEANDWAVTYSITSIYDDYAIAYNHEACEYERIYYEKDDNTDSLSVKKKEKCYILDVTEDEKNEVLEVLDKIRI